jgi:V/A-type H+-transporting ATPase subunit F
MPNLEFFVIADAHTALAFSLAGVRGGVATTPGQARDLLLQSRQDPEVGLILISERLAEQIREVVDAARRDSVQPLILEIPDLAGPVARKESLLERLRALMGLPK